MFLNSEGKPVLIKMVKAIQDGKAYLSEVDGLIGDGDHGINMNKGFTLFFKRFESTNITFSEGLDELGTILFNEVGGSMGPIYGTIFMEMAKATDKNEKIDLELFSKIMDAGLQGLLNIVDARVGDKTLVDTLSPACGALHSSLKKGQSFYNALDEMKKAAKAGMESTINLVAKYGRSSRLGERSRGVLDAGATSCYILMEVLAEGIQCLLKI